MAELDLDFPISMNFSSITEDALVVRESLMVTYHLDVVSLTKLRLRLTFLTYSKVSITLKAGVCNSLDTDEPNLASSTIEVEYAEKLFTFQSSVDDVQEVSEDQFQFDLIAQDVVPSIHSSSFEVYNCQIDSYSTTIKAGSTYVSISLHLVQQGEFSSRLPERSVQSLTGEFNAAWELMAEYTESRYVQWI